MEVGLLDIRKFNMKKKFEPLNRIEIMCLILIAVNLIMICLKIGEIING